MLARLDELEGVAESRVDWTGMRFLLTLEAGAAPARVAAEAGETLGGGARVLDGEQARDAVASYRQGETWMRAGETLRLSEYEAGVLAERHGGEAARELSLDEDRTRRLIALFEDEFDRAFERTHAGAGIEAVPAEFEAAAGRILDASSGFLEPDQRTALAEYLKRFRDARTR